MKIRLLGRAVFSLIVLSAVSFAVQYQTGKIIKVEKQESHASSGGTDAPTMAEVASYNISIQLGDKVYVCRYDSHSEQDLSWTEGKEVQVRVSGKTMYVKKANGQDAKGIILKTESAMNP